ncbi:MAG: alpha-E domain-containing protein, partial [Planctomycetota bacterium]
LIDTTGDRERFEELYGEPDRDSVLRFLLFDLRNPNSVLACLRSAREGARTVRENISDEMWEEINKLFLSVKNASADASVVGSPTALLRRVRAGSGLIVGMTETTMSHGEAWHFVRLGRLLERADMTSRIVDVKYFILLPQASDVGTPVDIVQWSSLLKSVSALQMYRRTHGRISPERVAEFLLLDNRFPRAVRFCLIKAEESLHAITAAPFGGFSNTAEKALGRLRSEFDFTGIDDVIAAGLHEFIDLLQARLIEVGIAVDRTFFSTADGREA